MEEAEQAKADMYGKGKRNRSQIISNANSFFNDESDSESSFEEANKPRWAFESWLRKEHPGEMGNAARLIWENNHLGALVVVVILLTKVLATVKVLLHL